MPLTFLNILMKKIEAEELQKQTQLITEICEKPRYQFIIHDTSKQRTEPQIEALGVYLKKFSFFQEASNLITFSEIIEASNYITLHRIRKDTAFNLHKTRTNSLFFIIKGQLWTLKQIERSDLIQTQNIQLSEIPSWKIFAHENELENILAKLAQQGQKKQGQRLIADKSEILNYLAFVDEDLNVKLRSLFLQQKHSLWTKAKDALNLQAQAPKLMLRGGDFFCSHMDNQLEEFIVFNDFIAADNSFIIEITNQGLCAMVEKMKYRFKKYELAYFEQFSQFEDFKKRHFELLQETVVSKVFPKGFVLWEEGSKSTSFCIVREGEIELFTTELRKNFRTVPRDLHYLMSVTQERKIHPFIVVGQNQIFGDEQICDEGKPIRKYGARVKSVFAAIQTLSYQDYLRISKLQQEMPQYKTEKSPSHRLKQISPHRTYNNYLEMSPPSMIDKKSVSLKHRTYDHQIDYMVQKEDNSIISNQIHLNDRIMSKISNKRKRYQTVSKRSKFTQIQIVSPLIGDEFNTKDHSNYLKIVRDHYSCFTRKKNLDISLPPTRNVTSHKNRIIKIQQGKDSDRERLSDSSGVEVFMRDKQFLSANITARTTKAWTFSVQHKRKTKSKLENNITPFEYKA